MHRFMFKTASTTIARRQPTNTRETEHLTTTVFLWKIFLLMSTMYADTTWSWCAKLVPVAHFTNDFSIIIQIGWEIGFSVTPLYGIISPQNFAQLSWHVQYFIAVTSQQHGSEQGKIAIKIEFPWRNLSWIGPQGLNNNDDDLRHSGHMGRAQYNCKVL